MIRNDLKNDLLACFQSRGMKNFYEGAKKLGMTRQRLHSVYDMKNIIRPTFVSVLEKLGYDIEIKFVRTLPPEEYDQNVTKEVIDRNIARSARGNSMRSYVVRKSTIRLDGESILKFGRTTGKRVLNTYDVDGECHDWPVIREEKRWMDANTAFTEEARLLNSEVIQENGKDIVCMDILVLEELMFDENGEIVGRKISKKTAHGCGSNSHAEYIRDYQRMYREKKRAEHERRLMED